MNDEPDTLSKQTTSEPATLAALLDVLEAGTAKHFSTITQFGQASAVQIEGEVRRGAIAMNAAGLLAVISPLIQSLHEWTVRAAALVYLAGIIFGWIGWARRAQSAQMAWLAEMTYANVWLKLRADPFSTKPLATVDELARTEKLMHALVEEVGKRLKAPGNSVPLWTYLALGCFLLATIALVADFEISPLRPPALLATAHSYNPPSQP